MTLLTRKKKKKKLEDNANVGSISAVVKHNLEICNGHKKTKSILKEKKRKLLKKQKRMEHRSEVDANNHSHCLVKDEDSLDQTNPGEKTDFRKTKQPTQISCSDRIDEAYIGKVEKVKKAKNNGKKVLGILGKKSSLTKADSEKVDEISSVDEDCSRGMKKWLIKYSENRPGLKVRQQRIDEFITVHEAQQEQERKEREAQAAEGGWTVVTHHKGRKKTTDAESGIAVGSVSQAAVLDNISKKKNKEVALDFYRFQKREAQRNEVMMLQSKFEQDKKRIQQLRAARKFRPY